jgi:Fe-S oxidoreductase
VSLVDPTVYTIVYFAAYGISVVSVLAIIYSFFYFIRKMRVSPSVGRLLALSKDEGSRLFKADSVLLMHLSIVLGVALSIVLVLLDPFWNFLPFLRFALLIISLPLDAGLVTALLWRVQRLSGSRKTQRMLGTDAGFSSASTKLQFILLVVILLTTSELVLDWFQSLIIVTATLNIIRNFFAAGYYARPSANLLKNFDRPLSKMTVPFKLSDVLEGKVDASQIKIGVSTISEFADFEKSSFHSCVEIGVCESSCPATAAGRPLSPRVLVRKLDLLEKAKGERVDPFETIQEEELWSCTTCNACVQSCPVGVRHLDIIQDLRRTLVSAGKLDKKKSALLENLVQHQNPYGFSSGTRADWARDQGIPTLEENPSAEYLYFVGCVSSFDQRSQNVAKSLSKILKTAGISFAILGKEEICNGDPARRLGEEGRYQELAAQNIEKMNSYKVKRIVTSCPHCFNTIKNEYPTFGGNYEVTYHTQLISEIIKKKKISIPESKLREISVTLHDACFAARYNSVSDEPRSALRAASKDVREMNRHGEKTFCCGAGGSNYWYSVPQQKTISSIRTEEAVKTGAQNLATECPFCLSMFEDSIRVSNAKIVVKDVAEIVADQMRTLDP